MSTKKQENIAAAFENTGPEAMAALWKLYGDLYSTATTHNHPPGVATALDILNIRRAELLRSVPTGGDGAES